jgi:hypothetical protein
MELAVACGGFRDREDAQRQYDVFVNKFKADGAVTNDALAILKGYDFSDAVIKIDERLFMVGGSPFQFFFRCISENLEHFSPVKGFALTSRVPVSIYQGIAQKQQGIKYLYFIASSVIPDERETVLRALRRLDQLESIFFYTYYPNARSRSFSLEVLKTLALNSDNKIQNIGGTWNIPSPQEFRSMFCGFRNLRRLEFHMNINTLDEFFQVFELIGKIPTLQTVYWHDLKAGESFLTLPETVDRVKRAFDSHLHLTEFTIVNILGRESALGPMIVKHINDHLKSCLNVLYDTDPNNLLFGVCSELKMMIIEAVFGVPLFSD